jgi:hypothetical protein
MTQLREHIPNLSKKVLAAGVLVAVLLVGLSATPPAHASTPLTVNSKADLQDINIADGICDADAAIGQLCTLRAAMQEANAAGGVDTIAFNIPEAFCDPSSGVATISPDSPLPPVPDTVSIAGYTQPGASPNTQAAGDNAVIKVELNGANAGAAADGVRIATSNAVNTVVQGLAINRFEGKAISVQGGFAVSVEGNFIGTDPTGTQGQPIGQAGVQVADASNTTIGGTSPGARNLISGDSNGGVEIDNASSNKVLGNLIGTDKSGISDLGASFAGVTIVGSNNVVGGTTAAAANTNDPSDADFGPNNLQNFPVLSGARTLSGETTIKGELNSTPEKNFIIRFFSNSPGGDEGKKFIWQEKVTTNVNGRAVFTFVRARKVGVGGR